MKSYISAILIPALLLQLFGCYSYREITIDELKKYIGKDDMKIITEQTEFIVNRDSTEKNKLNWFLNDSSIIIQEKTLMQDNYANSTAEKNKEIKFKEIKSVAIDEPDFEKTKGLILLLMAIAIIITGYIVGQSIPTFNN